MGLLWFCGFFNYADRQSLSAVVPLLQAEFPISDPEIGVLNSAFMLVYASTSPFAGYMVDRLSRRLLIPLGLAFWSLICAATGFAGGYLPLVILRGAEGLGESFYFPASMSLLSDYHSSSTRSRALSIHQTSVYLGTAGGWFLGGALGSRFGWRSPFWVLGAAGIAYAVFLGFALIEPRRGGTSNPEPAGADFAGNDQRPLLVKISRIVSNPRAALLLCVFIGANFVATTFLSWLPTFIERNFKLGLSFSALTSTVWPLASLPGALLGGVLADRAARRSRGGRIRIQSLGLFLAAPFVYLTGWSTSVPILMTALLGAGFCKGIYDANIFASLFDVVRPEDRGTAAGLMNTVGWTGGLVAPVAIGLASQKFGLGAAITATAAVYLLVGLLALFAARLAGKPVLAT